MTLQGLTSKAKTRWYALRGFFEGAIPARYLPVYLTKPSRLWPPEERRIHIKYLDVVARRQCGEKEVDAFLKEWAIGTSSFAEAHLLYEMVYRDDQYHARKLLKPDSIVIDIGANIGTFARLASELTPQGAVYAFEPVPYTYSLLVKNAPRAIPIMKGLGAKTGKKTMFTSDIATGCAIITDSPHVVVKSNDYVNIEEIAMTSLDEFVEENKIPRVDFIKMDIEGYERFALEGARNTIRKFKPVVVMSAYHNPDDKVVLPQLMASFCPSYSCELSNAGEEDFIFKISE